jgi:hypothetical protein
LRFSTAKQETSALKTTILGGVIFLSPFVVLLLLAGKVHELMSTFNLG